MHGWKSHRNINKLGHCNYSIPFVNNCNLQVGDGKLNIAKVSQKYLTLSLLKCEKIKLWICHIFIFLRVEIITKSCLCCLHNNEINRKDLGCYQYNIMAESLLKLFHETRNIWQTVKDQMPATQITSSLKPLLCVGDFDDTTHKTYSQHLVQKCWIPAEVQVTRLSTDVLSSFMSATDNTKWLLDPFLSNNDTILDRSVGFLFEYKWQHLCIAASDPFISAPESLTFGRHGCKSSGHQWTRWGNTGTPTCSMRVHTMRYVGMIALIKWNMFNKVKI